MPAPQGVGLEVRATRVGASEVAELVEPGSHPYVTAGDIYARIVEGRQRPVSGTRVQLGNDLEGYVARRWADAHQLRVMRAWRTYAHPDVALAATPDYYVPPDALLECKVDRGGPSDTWVDLPRYVYWQVQAQLLCVGREVGYVAALVGSDLRSFGVLADPADQARLVAAVHAFEVQHLAPKLPPEPLPDDLLFTVLPKGDDVEDAAPGEVLDVWGQRVIAAAQVIRRAEADREEARATLARYMASQGVRLLRGGDWTAEVQERGGTRFLVVHDLTRTYRERKVPT